MYTIWSVTFDLDEVSPMSISTINSLAFFVTKSTVQYIHIYMYKLHTDSVQATRQQVEVTTGTAIWCPRIELRGNT